LFGQLFQCFKTVGAKGGCQYGYPLDPLLGQAGQGFIGVGFEPLGIAKTALEAGNVLILGQFQPFGHQTCGFHAKAVIGIPLLQIPFGHAVVGEQNLLRHAFGAYVLRQALRYCFYI